MNAAVLSLIFLCSFQLATAKNASVLRASQKPPETETFSHASRSVSDRPVSQRPTQFALIFSQAGNSRSKETSGALEDGHRLSGYCGLDAALQDKSHREDPP